jgi:primase-polymerase (primpol)-like protein
VEAGVVVDARRRVLTVRPEGIPEELKVRPQWVDWKLEERNGDVTKVPYTPYTGCKASSTDLLTWGTFEEALNVLRTGQYDGLGFVLSSGDPYCGVDLDKCRNPETGEVDAWAKEVVDDLDGYAEVSPRGRGVHVIVRGKTPNRRRGKIEVYSSERFFAMTGKVL